MARSAKQPPAPATSLFPFAPQILQHRRAGPVLATAYFSLMLVVGLTYHVVGDYNVETDFYWSYVPQARQILAGDVPIEDFRGPAYPMILALISLFTRDLFHAGIVLSTLAAAVTLLFVFELLRRLARADIALLGTLIVAANTTFVQYSYTAGTDMVFTSLVTAAAFLLFGSEELRWRTIVGAALLSALAYLTRYNGIFVVFGVPAAFMLANPFHHDMRKRVLAAALFLGVFLLAIAPWGTYCLIEKGSFFYNRNYLNIAYEMFAKGRITWDQYWSVEAQKFTSLTQVIAADPGRFVSTLVGNVFEHAVSDLGKLLGWHLGVFALAGAVMMVKEKPGERVLAYSIFGASYFAVLLLVFYGERFSMYLLPLYIFLTLKAFTWHRLAPYRFWNRIQIGGVAAILALLWSATLSYEFNRANIGSGPREVVEIAKWFRQSVGEPVPGTVIVARKPHIAYYLDMTMQLFPYVDKYEQLLEELRKANASYLYFSLMEAGMRPQFQYLLNPAEAPPELRPLTYTVSPPAVLYKVELDGAP